MGTRADFYVGRGSQAEWIGSVAYNGHPDQYMAIHKSKDEATFRKRVSAELKDRDDATTPEKGWPWPWDDSKTTDYAYAFDGGKVWASGFGHGWFDPLKPETEDLDAPKSAEFPNMAARRNMPTLGGMRSGVLVIG